MKKAFAPEDVEEMFHIPYLMGILKKIELTKADWEKAKKLAQEKKVSKSDSLHAVLAGNNGAILVTQNIKDFEKFKDSIVIKRPEEIV